MESQSMEIAKTLNMQERTNMFSLLRGYYRTGSFKALRLLHDLYGFDYDDGAETGENQGVERGQNDY